MYALKLNKVEDDDRDGIRKKKIKGRVVLMKKNVLDLNDFSASVVDRLDEFLGRKVSLQLISSVNADPGFFVFFVLLLTLDNYLALYSPLSSPS